MKSFELIQPYETMRNGQTFVVVSGKVKVDVERRRKADAYAAGTMRYKDAVPKFRYKFELEQCHKGVEDDARLREELAAGER